MFNSFLVSWSFAAYRFVWLDPDVAVPVGPAFACIVLKADPKKICFWPVINHQMRPGFTSRCYDWKGRVQLLDHFGFLSWRRPFRLR